MGQGISFIGLFSNGRSCWPGVFWARTIVLWCDRERSKEAGWRGVHPMAAILARSYSYKSFPEHPGCPWSYTSSTAYMVQGDPQAARRPAYSLKKVFTNLKSLGSYSFLVTPTLYTTQHSLISSTACSGAGGHRKVFFLVLLQCNIMHVHTEENPISLNGTHSQ